MKITSLTSRESAYGNFRDEQHDYPHDHHACGGVHAGSYAPDDVLVHDASGG